MGLGETPAGRRPDRTVEVVPYDPRWPQQFELERELLSRVLPTALSIEHVGSTSVPGLSAKPTIDILVVMIAEEALGAIEQLSAIGYDYRPRSFPDESGHLFFRKVANGKRTHHLHVLSSSSPAPAEYRLFREFLVACPGAARRYEAEKLRLAEKYRVDRTAYVLSKQEVVEELLREARVWRSDCTGTGAAFRAPPSS